MSMVLDFPWNRYALIADLAYRFHVKSQYFGKTALQKVVFLLQELNHQDVGYDFSFYTYGPFSSELLTDLDILEILHGVKVEYINSGIKGFQIHPGDQNEYIRKKAETFLSEVRPAVERVLTDFGHLKASELELRATLVYADRDLMRSGQQYNKQEFIDIIKEIKPHFDKDTICVTLSELEEKGYIEMHSVL